MKYRIHFTINQDAGYEYEDSFDIEGESIEEIREKVAEQEKIRGLEVEKNNLWSEEI